MNGFQSAFSGYEALRAIEEAIVCHGEDGEQDLHAATVATDAAFQRMVRFPSSNGMQAAAKLATAVAHYPGFGGGMDQGDLAFVLVECMRFLVGGEMRQAAA